MTETRTNLRGGSPPGKRSWTGRFDSLYAPKPLQLFVPRWQSVVCASLQVRQVTSSCNLLRAVDLKNISAVERVTTTLRETSRQNLLARNAEDAVLWAYRTIPRAPRRLVETRSLRESAPHIHFRTPDNAETFRIPRRRSNRPYVCVAAL